MKKAYLLFIGVILVSVLAGCLADDAEKMVADNSTIQSGGKESLPNYSDAEPFFSYTGIGDDVVDGLFVEEYSFLKVTHLGSGYFSIKAHYGDHYDLLINTTDSYNQGCTLLIPEREYTLEVNAQGEWTVDAYTLGTSSENSFSGTGDCVTPIFLSTTDVYEITADGDGYFSVKGYYENGRYDLLVNTTDPYSGKVMFKANGEYAFFEITGNRSWTILADGTDTPVPVNPIDNSLSEDIVLPVESRGINGQVDNSLDNTSPSNNSLLTEEQQEKINEIESTRRKNTFMLAIAQDDLEMYYWGGNSLYSEVWQQLYIDKNYNANAVWETIKNDLNIYNTFENSDYADLWIMASAVYDKYETGELKESLAEEEYQRFIDKITAVTNRLGIFYASREIADSFSSFS